MLKLAKGYVGSKSTIYKTAHEQVMRSWQYAYVGRKTKTLTPGLVLPRSGGCCEDMD
ncbi:MAG: 50S ribosomal protein L20 [Sweet potato little leaf phytoplasma]|nr:50S ribosomal protein L20 [Sweet potato little leaf phytoplasma]